MIDWNKTTRDEILRINSIAKMACYLDPLLDLLSVQMDLEACHTHGCPLDLERLHNADQVNLMHDIAGISRHLDRDTGQLGGNFLPRFARQEIESQQN